jgi:subtilisin family serine protease
MRQPIAAGLAGLCVLATVASPSIARAAPPSPASPIGAADGVSARAASGGHAARAARSAAAAATPDPLSARQWALRGDGPMGVASAWRQTTGGGVTVAILDSGADLTHPDIAPNLWSDPQAGPGVHGYNVLTGDGDVGDDNGHGTHVAGIVGALGGNHIGGTGVAWHVRLMIVKVLDAQGQGTTGGIAEGIAYAVDHGARIINLSLTGPNPAADLEDAIRYAQDHGVLVVAAVGNGGADLTSTPEYPASLPEDNVIGVASTTPPGGLSLSSDFGPGADVAAPGDNILSTAAGGGYEWRTGTSMAAAQVSGALALLAAARPDLSGPQLRDALYAGVRHTGLPLQAGRIDIGASLRTLIPPADWKAARTAPAPRRRARAPRRGA